MFRYASLGHAAIHISTNQHDIASLQILVQHGADIDIQVMLHLFFQEA